MSVLPRHVTCSLSFSLSLSASISISLFCSLPYPYLCLFVVNPVHTSSQSGLGHFLPGVNIWYNFKICPMFVLSSLTQSTLSLQFSLAKQLYLGILDRIHTMYMYLLALKKKASGSSPTHLVSRSKLICVNSKGHIQKEENWGFLETGLHFLFVCFISLHYALWFLRKIK